MSPYHNTTHVECSTQATLRKGNARARRVPAHLCRKANAQATRTAVPGSNDPVHHRRGCLKYTPKRAHDTALGQQRHRCPCPLALAPPPTPSPAPPPAPLRAVANAPEVPGGLSAYRLATTRGRRDWTYLAIWAANWALVLLVANDTQRRRRYCCMSGTVKASESVPCCTRART